MKTRAFRVTAAALCLALCIGAAVAEESANDDLPAVAQKPDDSSPSEDGRRKRAAAERKPDRLQVGDPAPDFTLKSLDGPETTTLSDFRGKRPVVLIFGSYT